MYRDVEDMQDWPDTEAKLGEWMDAFTTATANPDGVLEPEADFSEPRVAGQATKARNRGQEKTSS